MPVDYSKFDKIGDDSDEEKPKASSGPTAEQRAEAAARAAMASSSDDPRAEIDKLKAAKRAAREAREAREAAEGGSKPEEEETAPSAPVNVASTEAEPLLLLRKAEGIQLEIKSGMSTAEAALIAGEKVDVSEISTLNGLIGKLQIAIDSISIGDLEEGEERDAARARRKVLNAFVEEVMPEVQALRKKVIAS
jgi:hypothetical protein